jgi:hypothetical protein
MRNRDFVSDGFLALVGAGLLLLFSILLAVALSSWPGTLTSHRPDAPAWRQMAR